MKPTWILPASRALGLALLASLAQLSAQEPADPEAATSYLPSAQFKIPFNIELLRGDLREVQLWVSTDEGESWQMHGVAHPGDRWFDFRAAAEGLYFFSVQTIDAEGNAFPSPSPPLRVTIDTSKPLASVRAEINAVGQLVAEIHVTDENLLPDSAVLKLRTDRDAIWRDVDLSSLQSQQGELKGQVTLDLPACREVALALAVRDQANNSGEATCTYVMPRTAAGSPGMTLASTIPQTQRSRIPDVGATQSWEASSSASATPAPPPPSAPVSSPVAERAGPGRLTGKGLFTLEQSDSPPTGLALDGPETEELPLPAAIDTEPQPQPSSDDQAPLQLSETASRHEPRAGIVSHANSPDRAFHCKSRTFSLDYSVEALGGTALSDVELWGTEDGGTTWNKWGSDPDRTSPFDVQVGVDGLFGFRMVVIAGNGLVSNRPRDGDNADMWIHVDTQLPTAKITRAIYGEGTDEGMLVFDYLCSDQHLVDRPISLSYSERPGGPWTEIAAGIENTGTYRWKASPSLPEKIFVRLECVDKAGNIGEHRLDVPIDTRGLGPRGRIQGFRPIFHPN